MLDKQPDPRNYYYTTQKAEQLCLPEWWQLFMAFVLTSTLSGEREPTCAH